MGARAISWSRIISRIFFMGEVRGGGGLFGMVSCFLLLLVEGCEDESEELGRLGGGGCTG